MSDKLRDAVEVWRDAAFAYGGLSIPGETEHYAAAVIQQDRAELVAAIVADLRNDPDLWLRDDIADAIAAKWGGK